MRQGKINRIAYFLSCVHTDLQNTSHRSRKKEALTNTHTHSPEMKNDVESRWQINIEKRIRKNVINTNYSQIKVEIYACDKMNEEGFRIVRKRNCLHFLCPFAYLLTYL